MWLHYGYKYSAECMLGGFWATIFTRSGYVRFCDLAKLEVEGKHKKAPGQETRRNRRPKKKKTEVNIAFLNLQGGRRAGKWEETFQMLPSCNGLPHLHIPPSFSPLLPPCQSFQFFQVIIPPPHDVLVHLHLPCFHLQFLCNGFCFRSRYVVWFHRFTVPLFHWLSSES